MSSNLLLVYGNCCMPELACTHHAYMRHSASMSKCHLLMYQKCIYLSGWRFIQFRQCILRQHGIETINHNRKYRILSKVIESVKTRSIYILASSYVRSLSLVFRFKHKGIPSLIFIHGILKLVHLILCDRHYIIHNSSYSWKWGLSVYIQQI